MVQKFKSFLTVVAVHRKVSVRDHGLQRTAFDIIPTSRVRLAVLENIPHTLEMDFKNTSIFAP